MHAEMGPAIWILGSSGFISAQRTASVAVEPDCEPRLRRPVIQNNRVAKGVGERTLTTGGGDTGKGQAAVGRTRYTRELVGVGPSGVVKSDANFVGVIGVGRGVCLGLNNVRRRLGAGDQVDIRGAVSQWGHNFPHKPRERRISYTATPGCHAQG